MSNATDINYDPAIAAAKQAFMIQSGAQVLQDKFQNYGQERALHYADKAGLTPEVAIVGGAYWLYKNRKIPLHYQKLKLEITETQVTGSVGNVSFTARDGYVSGGIELNSLWNLVE